MRFFAQRLPAARGPDRGGAQRRSCGALYGEEYLNACAWRDVAEAPARGAVGRSRVGVRGTP